MFRFHASIRHQKGFTLVETIIVIIVVAVLSTMVVTSISRVRQQFSVTREAYKFSQDVKRAQNMAASATPYIDGVGNQQTVAGYGVYADISTTSGYGNNKRYIIYADFPTTFPAQYGVTTPTGNQQFDAADYWVETIDFSTKEPGVIITAITPTTGSKASFNFNIADSAVNLWRIQTADTHSIDVVFSSELYPTITKTVTVNFSGGTSIR